MSLIEELSALAKQAEKRGDNPSAVTLRATVKLLIADQSAVERDANRRRGDSSRQQTSRDRRRQSRDVTGSHDTSRDVTDANVTAPQGFPGPLPNTITTTATSSSRASVLFGEEADLGAQLTTDAGRTALAAVLATVELRASVTAEVRACLDGSRGPLYKPTAGELDVALSDYVTNGLSNGKWNAAHFRACIKRAKRADEDGPSRPPSGDGVRPGLGKRAFDTTLAAIEDM